MKKSKFTEEQIAFALHQVERGAPGDMWTIAACIMGRRRRVISSDSPRASNTANHRQCRSSPIQISRR